MKLLKQMQISIVTGTYRRCWVAGVLLTDESFQLEHAGVKPHLQLYVRDGRAGALHFQFDSIRVFHTQLFLWAGLKQILKLILFFVTPSFPPLEVSQTADGQWPLQ